MGNEDKKVKEDKTVEGFEHKGQNIGTLLKVYVNILKIYRQESGKITELDFKVENRVHWGGEGHSKRDSYMVTALVLSGGNEVQDILAEKRTWYYPIRMFH